MTSLVYAELTIFRAENAGFGNNILLQGTATSKFQELPPLPGFYLTKSLENQNFLSGINLKSGYILLDLSTLPFYISISIQKNRR